MQDEIRLGIVGYGHRGRGMLRLATHGFERVEPVSICDTNDELLRKTKVDYPDAQTFTDFDRMLNTVSMDALLVETPATLHGEFCAKALQKDINVMGDVPCVESLDQAQKLWKAQQNSKAFYMIGANPNMWGFVESAVDLKKRGLLGEPYYIEAEYIHDCRELWAETPWRATLLPIKYCTHSLGPILRLIDEDLKSVSCFDTGSHINQEQGQHDAMVAIFKTSSNIVVRLLTSFINNYPGWGHSYRIYGTKGYFERTPAYDGAGSARTLFYSTELYVDKRLIELPIHEMRPEYVGNESVTGHGGADYALLDRFFDAIRKGLPSPINLQESLRMTLPGIYAAESARRGGELVEIKYPWSKNG